MRAGHLVMEFQLGWCCALPVTGFDGSDEDWSLPGVSVASCSRVDMWPAKWIVCAVMFCNCHQMALWTWRKTCEHMFFIDA